MKMSDLIFREIAWLLRNGEVSKPATVFAGEVSDSFFTNPNNKNVVEHTTKGEVFSEVLKSITNGLVRISPNGGIMLTEVGKKFAEENTKAVVLSRNGSMLSLTEKDLSMILESLEYHYNSTECVEAHEANMKLFAKLKHFA